MSTASRHSELCSEQTIHIGQLTTPVQVRIYRVETGKYQVESSHYLKTAVQYMPHSAASIFECEEANVLGKYQTTLYGFYDQAVRRGYIPSETWLIANSRFLSLEKNV